MVLRRLGGSGETISSVTSSVTDSESKQKIDNISDWLLDSMGRDSASSTSVSCTGCSLTLLWKLGCSGEITSLRLLLSQAVKICKRQIISVTGCWTRWVETDSSPTVSYIGSSLKVLQRLSGSGQTISSVTSFITDSKVTDNDWV